METVKIEIEVPKEAHELFRGLFKICQSVKVALADGWDPAADLPVIITQSLVELAPMIQGCDQLPAEFKADPSAFIKASLLSASDIASLFIESN